MSATKRKFIDDELPADEGDIKLEECDSLCESCSSSLQTIGHIPKCPGARQKNMRVAIAEVQAGWYAVRGTNFFQLQIIATLLSNFHAHCCVVASAVFNSDGTPNDEYDTEPFETIYEEKEEALADFSLKLPEEERKGFMLASIPAVTVRKKIRSR